MSDQWDMSNVTSTQRWKVPADAELHWRSWEPDQYLIYHAQSGDTHYLNTVAAEVLRYLQGESATADELTKQLAGTVGMEPDNALFNQIEQLLQQLDGLGLIEPVYVASENGSGAASNAASETPSETNKHESS